MQKIIFVALGGALGSTIRYLIGLIKLDESLKFPIKTFIINLIGCLIIGIVVGVLQNYSYSQFVDLFIKVGFCGGFTTFSSFALESLGLFDSRNNFVSISYITLSIVVGIFMVYIGEVLIKNIIK